jgi:hypothetical protein
MPLVILLELVLVLVESGKAKEPRDKMEVVLDHQTSSRGVAYSPVVVQAAMVVHVEDRDRTRGMLALVVLEVVVLGLVATRAMLETGGQEENVQLCSQVLAMVVLAMVVLATVAVEQVQSTP